MGDAALQAILDTAVNGVVVIDESGKMLIFNRSAGKMFGYDPAIMVGKHISVLMPPEIGRHHDSYLAAYIRTGKAKIIGVGRETVGRRSDGSTFPIELAINEIRAGQRRQFAGVIRDLTDRNRLERQILDVSEREQRRMGREFHDGLCQELAGIAFCVKAMHGRLKEGGKLELEEVADITSMLQTAVESAKALARGLQPVDRLPRGLHAALQNLALDTAAAHRMDCRFECSTVVEMHDAESATHLYRIAQECVRDALLRPTAGRINIALRQVNGQLELTVFHNGKRPSGETSRDNPFAGELVLEMIQHRARVIGGRIQVKNQKGGLSVSCTIPNRKA